MPGTLPKTRIFEVQEGGSGSGNWVPLAIYGDIGGLKVTTPDGGETEITPHYGRDYRTNQMRIINQVRSGVPTPFTFEVEMPMELRSVLTKFKGKKNVRVRFFNGEYSVPTNYGKIFVYSNGYGTKEEGTFVGDVINDVVNPGDQLRRTYPQSFAYATEIDPLTVNDLRGTVIAFALNDIISVGYERSAGDISGEDTNNSGDKEFLAISAVDGATFSHVLWTANRGGAWVNITLSLANFGGTGIAKAGPNVVISGLGAGGGLAYASFESVKAGTAVFTRSTGIAGGTVVNDVIAVSANDLYAVGAAGAVYKSSDGGASFALLGTAVTANALSELAVADDQLIWAGGASGTLVKIYKDVMSVVAVNGLSTSLITALGVPPGRGSQLYIGSAAGNVHYTPNSTPTTGAPAFVARTFDNAGVGAIDGIGFAGFEGEIAYFIQTNGSSQSRLIRDHAGGKMGPDSEFLGIFTAPANSTLNALAVAGPNCVMAVGDVNGGQAVIFLYN